MGAKRESRAPAAELYTSTWFKLARRYVEQTGSPWFILSAKYGLTDPRKVIKGRIYNDALAVPERNNHGHAVILALIEIYHYPNLYHHLDGLNEDGTEDRRPGWPTLVNNRTTMLDNFDMEIREGHYTMIDPRMRAQALTFIVNAKGRAEAGPSYHDDLITGRSLGNEVVRQPKNFAFAMIG